MGRRDPRSGHIVEMEVAISGKGYVFRGQTPGVAGKSFKPVASPCHHAARMLNDLQFGADGEKPCHYAVSKPQHADNQSLRNCGVEDESSSASAGSSLPFTLFCFGLMPSKPRPSMRVGSASWIESSDYFRLCWTMN